MNQPYLDANLIDQVTVVVITYNSGLVVGQALRAVGDGPRVIVVDNASADRSVSVVRKFYPAARIIVNSENVGFARAVNQAAAEVNTPYLLLLNPDATLRQSDLDSLANTIRENAMVAIAAPLTIEGSGGHPTIAAGMSPNLWRVFTHSTGISRLGSKVPFLRGNHMFSSDVQPGSLHDVDWVSGGCMLVRFDVWKELGGLSERWFMYAEDIEFCIRARRAGYRVVVSGSARADHEVGASSSTRDLSNVSTMWLENLFDLYRTEIAPSRFHAWLWKYVMMSGFTARSLFLRLRPNSKEDVVRFRVYASALRRI